MKIITKISFILIILSGQALAENTIEKIKSHIDQALQSKDMNHKSWYKAAELLAPLIEAKNQDAIYYSTFLHAYGVGGYAQNINKATTLLREAAESGSVTAMVSQARHNEHGLSGHINISKAVYWYKKAGKSGSRSAASRIAEAYRNGEIGLTKNIKLADEWDKIKGDCKKP